MDRKKLIIDATKDDIIPLEDGFYVFWVYNKGGLKADDLRVIADHIDELNEPIDKELEEFFKLVK